MGSITLVIPKTIQMGPAASLHGTQHQGLDLGGGGLDHPLIPECGSAAAQRSLEEAQILRTNFTWCVTISGTLTSKIQNIKNEKYTMIIIIVYFYAVDILLELKGCLSSIREQ